MLQCWNHNLYYICHQKKIHILREKYLIYNDFCRRFARGLHWDDLMCLWKPRWTQFVPNHSVWSIYEQTAGTEINPRVKGEKYFLAYDYQGQKTSSYPLTVTDVTTILATYLLPRSEIAVIPEESVNSLPSQWTWRRQLVRGGSDVKENTGRVVLVRVFAFFPTAAVFYKHTHTTHTYTQTHNFFGGG